MKNNINLEKEVNVIDITEKEIEIEAQVEKWLDQAADEYDYPNLANLISYFFTEVTYDESSDEFITCITDMFTGKIYEDTFFNLDVAKDLIDTIVYSYKSWRYPLDELEAIAEYVHNKSIGFFNTCKLLDDIKRSNEILYRVFKECYDHIDIGEYIIHLNDTNNFSLDFNICLDTDEVKKAIGKSFDRQVNGMFTENGCYIFESYVM